MPRCKLLHFDIRLPLLLKARKVRMGRLTSFKILVVDDEDGIREVLRDELEYAGATVIEANSGNKGFDAFLKHHPDAVISDVRMPDGDGLGLLKRIRLHHPSVPKVFMVSAFSDLTSETAKKLGAEMLFPKPFELEHLVNCVALALGK